MEGRRPDGRRRGPASRPSRSADTGRERPRTPARRDVRSGGVSPGDRAVPRRVGDARSAAAEAEGADVASTQGESLLAAVGRRVEQQAEQRFGTLMRRLVILAVVVIVLTLTVLNPVQTWFSQRAEMQAAAATESRLREQIAELQIERDRLADPAYIRAQARERLGFVMPGDIPYEVQLPSSAGVPAAPTPDEQLDVPPDQPWYTSLWQTIAEPPRLPPAPAAPVPAPPGAPVPPPVPGG